MYLDAIRVPDIKVGCVQRTRQWKHRPWCGA